jgi:hypothetical protein
MGARGQTGAQGQSGAQGQTGAQGPKGDTGQTGSQGLQGDQGVAGTARAYGSVPVSCAVGTTCTLSAASNATVTHPFTGIYCIAVPGLTPDVTGVIATPEDNSLLARIAYLGAGASCSPLFEIQIVNNTDSSNLDAPFFFAIP